MYPQKTYTVTELADRALKWVNSLTPIQFVAVVAIAGLIIAENTPKTYYYNTNPKPILRKNFTESTKKSSRFIQGQVCNSCKKYTDLWEYHHRDRDRSNNSLENCEALCPYCHAEKTRRIV